MSFKLIVALASCLATVATPALAENNSASLLQLVAACGENTKCSNQQTGEGMLFKLRHSHRTQNLLCQEDGNCVAILAKGQRMKINDGLTQLKAQ
jgi:hypothetical protein